MEVDVLISLLMIWPLSDDTIHTLYKRDHLQRSYCFERWAQPDGRMWFLKLRFRREMKCAAWILSAASCSGHSSQYHKGSTIRSAEVAEGGVCFASSRSLPQTACLMSLLAYNRFLLGYRSMTDPAVLGFYWLWGRLLHLCSEIWCIRSQWT